MSAMRLPSSERTHTYAVWEHVAVHKNPRCESLK